MLHRIAFIEKAGTGIKRIRDEARKHGCPEPIFETTGFFTATFAPNPEVRALAKTTPQVTPQVIPEVTPEVAKLLRAVHGAMTRTEIMAAIRLKDRMHFTRVYLAAALELAVIEMTIPDKPNSSKQRYRLTAKGQQLLMKRATKS